MVRRALFHLIPTLFFKWGAHGVWRRLPKPLRRSLVGLVSRPLPDRSPRCGLSSEGPVAVVGLHRAASSAGWVARGEAIRWRRSGVEPLLVDVSGLFGSAGPTQPAALNGSLADLISARTVVLALHPHQMRYTLSALPKLDWNAIQLQATFVWDLEDLPEEWRPILALFDRLIVPSTWVRDNLRANGIGQAIDVVPYDIDMPDTVVPDRGRFGLPADKTIFLVAFNYHSGIVRKNVLGAIDAFKAAADGRDDIALVIKSHDSHAAVGQKRQVTARIAGHDRIIELDTELTGQAMWTLIASVDAVLSPHRSEGFGLVLKQGLMLDRYVIGTDWSGPTDFLTGPNAIRLPYTLVPVVDPGGPFARFGRQRWAEADRTATIAAIHQVADLCARRRAAPPAPPG